MKKYNRRIAIVTSFIIITILSLLLLKTSLQIIELIVFDDGFALNKKKIQIKVESLKKENKKKKRKQLKKRPKCCSTRTY